MPKLEIKIEADSTNAKVNTIDINGATYFGEEGFIASQRDMLIGFRDDGRVPSQALLDDIASYQFILDQGLTKEYLEWRTTEDGIVKMARNFPGFVTRKKGTEECQE